MSGMAKIIQGNSELDYYKDIAVVDLGNGQGALATIALTRTLATVALSTSSTALFSSNTARVAGRVVNNGTSNLWIQPSGAAAVVGAPGTVKLVPGGIWGYRGTNAVYGIWDAAGSGSAATSDFEA